MKKLLSKLIPSHITIKLSLLVSIFVIVAFTTLETYNFLHAKSEVTQKINTEQYAQAKFIAKDIKEKIIDRVRFLNGLANIIASEKIQSEALLLETIKSHLNLTAIFPQGFAVFRPEVLGFLQSIQLSLVEINFHLQNQNGLLKLKIAKL